LDSELLKIEFETKSLLLREYFQFLNLPPFLCRDNDATPHLHRPSVFDAIRCTSLFVLLLKPFSRIRTYIIMASSSSSMLLRQVVQSKELKWAIGGWTFFIAENAILSENRTYLIRVLDGDGDGDGDGDEHNYHLLYGSLSTAATASIGYAYYHLTRKTPALVHYFKSSTTTAIRPPLPIANLLLSWTCLSVGLVLASQALPKMQIPIRLTSSSSSQPPTIANGNEYGDMIGPSPRPPPSPAADAAGWKLSVQCPFDFSDKYKDKTNSSDNGSSNNSIMVTGVDRVSRHVGLWSLGLMSASQAALIIPSTAAAVVSSSTAAAAAASSSPSLFAALWSLRLWWCGPLAVAWLGGMHTDSRFRRGMGGTLDPMLDCQTSNLPFLAMLTGKQNGSPYAAFMDLWSELKPLNATMAIAAATLWIMSKGRASSSSSSTIAAAASRTNLAAAASTATPKIRTTTGASSSSSSLSSRRKRPW
jgi:hypothetical protein